MNSLRSQQPPLLADVRQLIDAARQRVAQAVNAELTQLYWQIGCRTPLFCHCERSAAIHASTATTGLVPRYTGWREKIHETWRYSNKHGH